MLGAAVVTSTCLSCSHPSLPWAALLPPAGWRLWLLEPVRKRGWQGGGKEANSNGNAPLGPKTDIVDMWESLGEERGKHLGDSDGSTVRLERLIRWEGLITVRLERRAEE